MDQNTTQSLDDILAALNTINSSLSFAVYLPISKKTVRFKQMTTGQEKRIAKQLLVGDNKTIYSVLPEILQENCLDQQINIENLSIIDFFCIILQTRIYSIGNQITIRTVKKSAIDTITKNKIKNKNIAVATDVSVQDEAKTSQPDKKKTEKLDVKIDLIKIYESIVDTCKDHQNVSITIDNCPYQIVCDIPSVKMIRNKNETEDDNLISRLMKFVSELHLINPKTNETKKIDLSAFMPDEAKKIIENIPNQLLVKASEKIIDFYTLLTTIQLYKFKLGGTEYFQTINFLSLDFFTSF